MPIGVTRLPNVGFEIGSFGAGFEEPFIKSLRHMKIPVNILIGKFDFQDGMFFIVADRLQAGRMYGDPFHEKNIAWLGGWPK
jgi:hypothetical protein